MKGQDTLDELKKALMDQAIDLIYRASASTDANEIDLLVSSECKLLEVIFRFVGIPSEMRRR